MGVCMCVLGSCKSNVMIHAGYIEEDLNITTKISINPKMGVCMCVLGACKSNVMVHTGYI